MLFFWHHLRPRPLREFIWDFQTLDINDQKIENDNLEGQTVKIDSQAFKNGGQTVKGTKSPMLETLEEDDLSMEEDDLEYKLDEVINGIRDLSITVSTIQK